MLNFLDKFFDKFLEHKSPEAKKNFSRSRTWQWFYALTILMMLRKDQLGVTSFVRSENSAPRHYEAMDGFFHSNAFDLEEIRKTWLIELTAIAKPYKLDGYCILHGDTTIVPREGKRMPMVLRMKQSSEDNSKSGSVFCQDIGSIGLLIGDSERLYSAPLSANFHYATETIEKWLDKQTHPATVRILMEAAQASVQLDQPCLLALDRFYFTRPALEAYTDMHNEGINVPDLVLRAPMNYVAYEFPPERPEGQRGRPRKKGDKVVLADLFDQPEDFTIVRNKKGHEQYRYLCRDLLWGQKLYQPLRFVLTILPDGRKAILASTNLELNPETIKKVYETRFKIEECYKIMKHDVGTFSCHFWSKAIPKLNRFAPSRAPDRMLEVKNKEDQEKILKCVRAYEMYFQIGCIATGLLMALSLKAKDSPLWNAFYYTRDGSGARPSVRNLMESLQVIFPTLLLLEPDSELAKFLADLARSETVDPEVWADSVFDFAELEQEI